MDKNESKKSIEIKLIDDISNSKVTEVAFDIAEVGLDSILDEGLLRDLSGFSFISGIIKTTVNIRERIFIKKILVFLQSLNTCDVSERKSFVKKLNSNKKQKIGEHLIMLLERIDDIDKPKIIANLFKAFIQEKIEYDDFIKLSSIVSKTHLIDLRQFYTSYYNNGIKEMSRDLSELLFINGLMGFGILEQKMTFDMDKFTPEIFYVTNDIGKKMIKYAFS